MAEAPDVKTRSTQSDMMTWWQSIWYLLLLGHSEPAKLPVIEPGCPAFTVVTSSAGSWWLSFGSSNAPMSSSHLMNRFTFLGLKKGKDWPMSVFLLADLRPCGENPQQSCTGREKACLCVKESEIYLCPFKVYTPVLKTQFKDISIVFSYGIVIS